MMRVRSSSASLLADCEKIAEGRYEIAEPLGIELVFVVRVVELDIADQTIRLLDRQFEVARHRYVRRRPCARQSARKLLGERRRCEHLGANCHANCHDRKQHSQQRPHATPPSVLNVSDQRRDETGNKWSITTAIANWNITRTKMQAQTV
jgi:hypothetical protein